MKWVSFLVSILLVINVSAQGFNRVTISRFDKPNDKPLIDTLKNYLEKPGYNRFISEEVELTRSGANDLKMLNKLVGSIRSNGSDDISKCFYPRHSINYYKDGQLVKYVLVCFECEGVRFSEQRRLTPVKNVVKRENQMEELQTIFKKYNLVN